MCRRYSDFTPVGSLSGLDEGNPDRANYNFRHVALTYQLYLEDDSIVDEDEVDRSRRIKLVTKLLAKIVGESVSFYKVYPAQAICLLNYGQLISLQSQVEAALCRGISAMPLQMSNNGCNRLQVANRMLC